MTCQHDPSYRIENESNGGSGCPLCNRYKRNEQRTAPEEWFVSASVTLADPATQALIEKTRRLWREAEAIEY